MSARHHTPVSLRSVKLREREEDKRRRLQAEIDAMQPLWPITMTPAARRKWRAELDKRLGTRRARIEDGHELRVARRAKVEA